MTETHYLYLRDEARNPDRVVLIARQLRDKSLHVTFASNHCGARWFFLDSTNIDEVCYTYRKDCGTFSKSAGRALCEQRLASGEHVVVIPCDTDRTHPMLALYQAVASMSSSGRVLVDAAGLDAWPPTVRRLLRAHMMDPSKVNVSALRLAAGAKKRSLTELRSEVAKLRSENKTLTFDLALVRIVCMTLFIAGIAVLFGR